MIKHRKGQILHIVGKNTPCKDKQGRQYFLNEIIRKSCIGMSFSLSHERQGACQHVDVGRTNIQIQKKKKMIRKPGIGPRGDHAGTIKESGLPGEGSM